MNKKFTFFIILIVAMLLVYTAVFGANLGFMSIKGSNDIRFGIDIKGGVEAIFAPKDLNRKPTSSELDSVRMVLETRLDASGILDREITVDNNNGEVIVRLPWKSDEKDFDPKKAVSELGETALLTFRDAAGNVLVEGKNVKSNSKPIFDQTRNGYVVQIEFDSTGAKLFEEATANNIGKQISIYMDDILISAPNVESKITGGQAIITGMESADAAKDLSDKINSGALPFSLEIKNLNTINPTLGNDALNVMINAGLLTFVLICIFMIVWYRIPGFVACIGLSIQCALQLLLVSIPQITLTLPGIAGIILSIGMGVDTNIIISERIREELNSGKTLDMAIKTGYHRAYAAVVDGNLTTAIVGVILMILGSGTMLSFGYTLITGVIMNFISGITASRLMVTSLSRYNGLRKAKLYGRVSA